MPKLGRQEVVGDPDAPLMSSITLSFLESKRD